MPRTHKTLEKHPQQHPYSCCCCCCLLTLSAFLSLSHFVGERNFFFRSVWKISFINWLMWNTLSFPLNAYQIRWWLRAKCLHTFMTYELLDWYRHRNGDATETECSVRACRVCVCRTLFLSSLEKRKTKKKRKTNKFFPPFLTICSVCALCSACSPFSIWPSQMSPRDLRKITTNVSQLHSINIVHIVCLL